MSNSDFADGFRVQGRVLMALILREARTRYGRRQVGYIWALIEPILWILGFYLIFTLLNRTVPLGESMLAFLATGKAPLIGFKNIFGRTMGGYVSNQALLSFPVVKIFDVFLGRALLELATWVMVTLIIFGGLILMGLGSVPAHIPTVMSAMFAMWLIAFGFGAMTGIVSAFVPVVGVTIRLPMRALHFISATFFLPDSMPPMFQDIIYWNPVMHGITLFRVGYYEGYESHILDPAYLWSWAVGCLLLALAIERAARKPLRSLM